MAAEPITSRFFPPAAFGTAATYFSVVGLVGILSGFRYELAILLPREDEDAANLFVLTFGLVLSVSLVAALLFGAFGGTLLSWMNVMELQPWWWLFPVGILMTGMELPLRFWCIRHRFFRRIAAARAMMAIPRVGAEVGGGWSGFTTGPNLILLRLVGYVVSPFVYLIPLRREHKSFLREAVRFSEIRRLARRYKEFPIFDTLSTFLVTASWHSPIILLTVFFDAREAGLFAKALYLLYLPILLVAESASQVFLQLSASKKTRGEPLGPVVEAMLLRIVGIGLFPLAMAAVIGPELFSFVLGSNWAESGEYVRIISPWLFVMFISSSIRTLFATLERQRESLLFNTVLFAGRLVALLVGGMVVRNAHVTMGLYTAISTVVLAGILLFLLRSAGASATRLLRRSVWYFGVALPTLILTGWINWATGATDLIVLAVATLSFLPYALAVLRQDPELRRLFTGLVR